jgi:hypothetical protein
MNSLLLKINPGSHEEEWYLKFLYEIFVPIKEKIYELIRTWFQGDRPVKIFVGWRQRCEPWRTVNNQMHTGTGRILHYD